MTPNAHSTQRRYPSITIKRLVLTMPPPAVRDPVRRAKLYKHLGFIVGHIADTVLLKNTPLVYRKSFIEEIWRTDFRNRHNGGRSTTTLNDDPLEHYVYDVEIDAVDRLKVTFPERPEQ